jgi:hypothetical protein
VHSCELRNTAVIPTSSLTQPLCSACLQCRAAKVRCLVSQRPDQCDRCTANNTDCVFQQPRRARNRERIRSSRRRSTLHEHDQVDAPSQASLSHSNTPVDHEAARAGYTRQPIISADIRARIISALAALKGKRGSPFSFVTSGDTPLFSASSQNEETAHDDSRQLCSERSEPIQPSLRLSWLLRPLGASIRHQAGNESLEVACAVKMPSYLSSMTLGQTITDPVESGILTRAAAVALFDAFMREMNAKWEYILDPHFDTYESVRQRSLLLLTTVLFCSSKFTNYVHGSLLSTTDPFLQTRLCSLARNFAVRTFAEGDRSMETMQAFYLLACWKDADDDVSYLHSGYAFRILQDMDLTQSDGDKREIARRRRIWLALFRQDKQQSLFFMRSAVISSGDQEGSPVASDFSTWLKMPLALPLDFMACCSANVRIIQVRMSSMVRKASPEILPCLLDYMDSELNRWKSTWQMHLTGEDRLRPTDDPILDQRLLHPGNEHLNTLVGLWEHSVRLNIASAILRQSLLAAVTSTARSNEQQPPSSLSLDLPTVVDVLSTDVPGLRSSIEGAMGTLRHLLSFPCDDLRRSPDSVLLLGPNAALFLCLLLCLPSSGILGPSFQKMAIDLIQEAARHFDQSVQSIQDTVALHATYLSSIVKLFSPVTTHLPRGAQETMRSPMSELPLANMEPNIVRLDETAPQTAHVLVDDGCGTRSNASHDDDTFIFPSELEQDLHMQSLANLLDPGPFWEMASGFPGISSEL